MNQNTLVLNASWVPIETISWEAAITKILNGKAYAVENYDYVIKTSNPRVVFMKPAVIVLNEYNKIPKRTVNYSKRLVCARDKWTCQYCNKRLSSSTATIDHVTPRSQGGKSTFENTVASCEPCNKRKANKTPKQAKMRLRRKPTRPKANPVAVKFGGMKINELWKEHLKHWLGEK